VTSGTRIVIQYDIYVNPREVEEIEEPDMMAIIGNQEPKSSRIGYGNDYEEDDEYPPAYISSTVEKDFKRPKASMAVLQKVIQMLDSQLKANKYEKIVIPLFHLYTSSSIKAEYLKNTDRELLIALLSTGRFEVGLSPLTVDAESSYDGVYKYYESCCFSASLTGPLSMAYTRFDHATGSFAARTVSKTDDLINRTDLYTMVYTRRENVKELSFTSYIEYVGNEAQPARYKYFHGVMIK
jgi:hypothetical protein